MAEFTGHELTCLRGERRVFAGVTFRAASGDALVLQGPNGAGKTSLLRLMAGLGAPARGTLRWDGADIAEHPDAHHARLCFVGHLDGVKPAFSVRENLAFWAAIGGHGETARVAAALDAFRLLPLADFPARFLSAGQRRRLNLARLLATEAPLWLLDEPEAALDREARETLREAIAGHRRGGGIVVVATHGEATPPAGIPLELRFASSGGRAA